MKASVRRWFNFNVMLRFCNNFLKLEVNLMFLLYYYFYAKTAYIHTYIHTHSFTIMYAFFMFFFSPFEN